MADPITALTAISLVGNITQFIGQALKVVAKGHEAYANPSGYIEENLNIEQTARDLRESSQKVPSGLSQ